MNGEQVRLLEREIERAIAEVFASHAPVEVPPKRVLHLMAKAAVTVVEAAEQTGRDD